MLKIEDYLAQETVDLDSQLNSEVAGMSYMEKDDFLESERFRIEQTKHTFPQLQRTSSLISLYLTLENSLNFLCQAGSRYSDSDIVLTDLVSTNLIERARIYLVKVLKLNFPAQNPTWKEIEKIQQIRNALVHNNGVVKSGNTALLGYIRHSSYIELVGYKIILKRGFSEYACNIIEKFFYEFFNGN
ncbi:hypothetical protein ACU5DF_02540 [Aliivibrio wodanis]|uniref:hypothetical protein n=1 Tax=Aliivibrio wodanis TaxID=80852 RepID=UPI00406D17C2